MDVNALIRTAEENEPAPSTAELTAPPELRGYEDEQDPGVGIAWRIENLQSADWALSRLAECEAEAAAIDAQAEAAIRRIRERADALKAKAAKGESFFRFKLAEYAERERKVLLHGKKKSREFLHGKIAWRTKPERLEVTDKNALAAWLALQPVELGLWRQTLAPEMRAIQEAFQRDGIVPPGMEVRPPEETLTVEAIAPEKALEE